MKKQFALGLLLVSVLFVFSCSLHEEQEAMVTPDENSLDATGRAFMSFVENRPEWER